MRFIHFESIRKTTTSFYHPHPHHQISDIKYQISMAANSSNPSLDRDPARPEHPGLELAQFGAGCFWGVELAFQRLAGVVKTEVGFSQGHVPDPTYKLVCSGKTNHVEVVRVQFDPNVCPYSNLLSLFWSRHDPTSLNRQVPF